MACDSDPIWADDNLRVEERGVYVGTDQRWSLLRFSHEGQTKERWAESRFIEVIGGSGGCTGASPSTVYSSPRNRLLSHPDYESRNWKVMLRTGPSMACDSDPIWADDNLQVNEIGSFAGLDQSWSLLRFTHNGVTKERWAETAFLENAGGTAGCSGATPSTRFNPPLSKTLSHPEYEARNWKVMLRTGPSIDCALNPIWADDNLQVTELGVFNGVDQSWSLLRFNFNGAPIERWAETKFLEVAGGSGGCHGASPSVRFNPPRSYKLSHPSYESKNWKVMLRTGPSMDCQTDPIWADDNLHVEQLGTYNGTDQSWSLLRYINNGVTHERWAETRFLEATGGSGPPINPLPNGIPIVIYDTDMGPDIDDALGLAALHAYQSQGLAHIAAVTLSRNSDTGARYIDLLNTFYARPDIPIGVYRGTTTKDTSEHGYTRDIVNSGKYAYSLDMNQVPQGHVLMRDVLRAAPDNSVVIIQVGFSTNTARLIEEYPDLVARKARLLSVMAGDFVMPGGQAGNSGEFNINVHPSSAQTVFSRWPNELVVSEVNLGAGVLYPLSSIQNDFNYVPNHPIKESYLNSNYSWHHPNGDSYDMRSWDITSVIEAIQPGVIPRVLGPGRVILNGIRTSFNHGTGSHYVLAESSQLTGNQHQRLVNLMIELTSAAPDSAQPPVSNDCGFLQPTSYVPNYFRSTVSHSNYNLRPQPNSSCDPIGLIVAGSQVRVHAETGNWRFIENLSGSGWGWIYKRALTGTLPPPSNCDIVVPTSTMPTYSRYTTPFSNYNLRPRPDSDCPPIGLVSAGSEVKVQAESGNWRFIQIAGSDSVGWIYKEAIDSPTDPTPEDPPDVSDRPFVFPPCEPGLPCPDENTFDVSEQAADELLQVFLEEIDNATNNTNADKLLLSQCAIAAFKAKRVRDGAPAWGLTTPEPNLDTSSGEACYISLFKHAQAHRWIADFNSLMTELIAELGKEAEAFVNHPVSQLLGLTDIAYCIDGSEAKFCAYAAAGVVPIPVGKFARLTGLLRRANVPARLLTRARIYNQLRQQAGRLPIPGSLSSAVRISVRDRIKDSSYAIRLDKNIPKEMRRDFDNLVNKLENGNNQAGLGAQNLGRGFYELRTKNKARIIVKQTSATSFDIVGKFVGHKKGDRANSQIIQKLMDDYDNLP